MKKKVENQKNVTVLVTTTGGETNLPKTREEITQDDLPALIAVFDKKIKDLQGDEEKITVITAELPGFGKISDIKDPNTLRAAYAVVSEKTEKINSHNEVFKALAPTIKVPTYKENGYTVEQWQAVIKAQYKTVVFKEELEKLNKARTLLQDSLSEKEKLRSKLADVFDMIETK